MVNDCTMINTLPLTKFKPTVKQYIKLQLKPLAKLETISIFAMPSRINDKDIIAMFKGVLNLMREQIKQEQTEKFLQLKLKYDRLKYLYNKSKK